jgi:hypothetical protein
MTAIILFKVLLFWVAFSFSAALLLGCYEGFKPGGYDKKCEKALIGASLVFGTIAAFCFFMAQR